MSGDYAVPPGIAHVVVEPSEGEELKVFLMRLPDAAPVALVGVGALIWLLAVEGESDLVGNVARSVAEPVAAIEATIHSYVAELVADGLLCLNPRSGGGT